MQPLVIYIHGFLSSPLSIKAQQTKAYIDEQQLPLDFSAPELSNYPQQAFDTLAQLVESNNQRPIGLIGSSLGGFMATALAERFGLKTVLINPAVRPHELLKDFLGEQQNPYTGEYFTLDNSHMQVLKDLVVAPISHPERLCVMLQAGDETLDYRQAVDYYRACPQFVEEGGNHSFENFEKHLPQVIKFLELV